MTEVQAAKVAVKARLNALRNPHAHLKIADITVEKVLESTCWPTRSTGSTCARPPTAPARSSSRPRGDAEDLAEHPAWVHAAVTAHDQQYMGDSPEAPGRDAQPDRGAGKKAYRRPASPTRWSDFDVAEIYEPATYAELAMCENLGFCEMGGGGRLIDAGLPRWTASCRSTRPAASSPRTRSGATALIRVAEAAMQVMGEAGEHQVDGVQPRARDRLRRQRLDRPHDPRPGAARVSPTGPIDEPSRRSAWSSRSRSSTASRRATTPRASSGRCATSSESSPRAARGPRAAAAAAGLRALQRR